MFIILIAGIFAAYALEIRPRVKLTQVDDCAEIWLEKDVTASGQLIKWILFAGNRCKKYHRATGIVRITKAVNVKVDVGEEFDLKEFTLPPNDRLLISIFPPINQSEKTRVNFVLLED